MIGRWLDEDIVRSLAVHLYGIEDGVEAAATIYHYGTTGRSLADLLAHNRALRARFSWTRIDEAIQDRCCGNVAAMRLRGLDLASIVRELRRAYKVVQLNRM